MRPPARWKAVVGHAAALRTQAIAVSLYRVFTASKQGVRKSNGVRVRVWTLRFRREDTSVTYGKAIGRTQVSASIGTFRKPYKIRGGKRDTRILVSTRSGGSNECGFAFKGSDCFPCPFSPTHEALQAQSSPTIFGNRARRDCLSRWHRWMDVGCTRCVTLCVRGGPPRMQRPPFPGNRPRLLCRDRCGTRATLSGPTISGRVPVLLFPDD